MVTAFLVQLTGMPMNSFLPCGTSPCAIVIEIFASSDDFVMRGDGIGYWSMTQMLVVRRRGKS